MTTIADRRRIDAAGHLLKNGRVRIRSVGDPVVAEVHAWSTNTRFTVTRHAGEYTCTCTIDRCPHRLAVALVVD